MGCPWVWQPLLITGWRRAMASFWRQRGSCRRSGNTLWRWSNTWRRCTWSLRGLQPLGEQRPGAKQVGLDPGPQWQGGSLVLPEEPVRVPLSPVEERAGSRGLHQGGVCLPLLLCVLVPRPLGQNRGPQSTISPCGPNPALPRALSIRRSAFSSHPWPHHPLLNPLS